MIYEYAKAPNEKHQAACHISNRTKRAFKLASFLEFLLNSKKPLEALRQYTLAPQDASLAVNMYLNE